MLVQLWHRVLPPGSSARTTQGEEGCQRGSIYSNDGVTVRMGRERDEGGKGKRKKCEKMESREGNGLGENGWESKEGKGREER